MDIPKTFQIQKNIPLAPLSTFKIGGKAKQYVKVGTIPQLQNVIAWAKKQKVPYKLFAGGSNIIFPDEDVDELVIHLLGGSWKWEGDTLIADAGVSLSSLVDESIEKGFMGLEYLSGIPGTIGGAAIGNAGAYGRSISDCIRYVEVFDGIRVKRLIKKECAFDYRESIFKKESLVVSAVCLEFMRGDENNLRKLSTDIIQQRGAKYHPNICCPGSFFKNIVEITLSRKSLIRIDQDVIIGGKIPAGYLLGEVGAKGMKVGDIEIASYHGNLFINKGKGKASDVKKIAEILKKKVFEKFQIQLEEEVRYF